MQIQRSHIKSARPRRSTLSTPNNQDGSFGDRVTLTALGAGKGALYGGATGVAAASLVVAGGALLSAASGDSIRITDVGEAMLQATAIVAPASAAVGATAGAISGGMNKPESTRTASMVAGGVAGVGTLGYAVYSVIQSLEGFMG